MTSKPKRTRLAGLSARAGMGGAVPLAGRSCARKKIASKTVVPTTGATAARRRTEKLPSPTVSRPALLVDGSDREFRNLVHGLFGFLAGHEAIRTGHARFIGLAGIEYTVLISIAHLAPHGAVSVTAVAAHLNLTGAFITTVCRKLLQLGLIEKAIDRHDRRRVSLTVAADGRRLLEQLAPVQRQVNDVEFGCLTAAEFRVLGDLVQRLIRSSGEAVALQSYLYTTIGPAAGQPPAA